MGVRVPFGGLPFCHLFLQDLPIGNLPQTLAKEETHLENIVSLSVHISKG